MDPKENTELNRQEIRQGHTILQSKPLQFNIDLTGQCNVNPPCVFCHAKSLGYKYDPTEIERTNRHLSWFAASERINDCSYGEPLTHPSFFLMVKQAQERRQVFCFSTNGLLLNREKADLLVDCGENVGMSVSLNAATPETYHRLKGKSFEQAVGNLRYYTSRYLERYGHTPPTSINMIVMKMNRAEVADFLKLGSELQVKAVNLRPLFDMPNAAPRNDFGYFFDYHKEMLSPDEYAEVAQLARSLAAELGLTVFIHWEAGGSAIADFAEPGVDIPCLMPWRFLFYQNHSGNVYICCYADAAAATLQDGESLDSVWNGEALVEIREGLRSGKFPAYCREHGKYCPLVLQSG